MKILIVDDNAGLTWILQVMLEEEGHEVRVAKDGREGYFEFLLFSPDIILTDIQMPNRNGLELIRLIRIHNPDVRTVYMSSDLDYYESVLQEEKEKHKACVLSKPFSRDELIKSLYQCSH
jgi:two-component system response regulator (stage 0 sporulation protein F)